METSLAPRQLLAEQASPARPSRAHFMALGSPAAPPLGYLDFCSRRPDQCGLDPAIDAEGRALPPQEFARALYAKFYWPVVYGDGVGQSVSVAASGQEPATAAPVEATPASYDLTGANGPTALATPAPGSDSLAPALWSDAHASLLTPALLVYPGTVQSTDAGAPRLQGAWMHEVRDDPYDGLLPAGPAVSAAFSTTEASAPAAASAPPTPEPEAAARPGPPMLAATPELKSMLNDVDLRVNGAIRFVHDRAQWGKDDYWTLPLDPGASRAGDCKDYVLEKRRALIDRGVPAEDLSIAIVRTPWGETHAVLLVSTDEGELVLDNLSSWVLPWDRTHYQWVERQAPGEQLVWVKVVS